jgi:hypothetical protein
MADLSEIEPTAIRAGDTITWKKTVEDYTAGDWTLKYHLRNATDKIDITAGATGSAFLVDIASATSISYTAGRYDWVACVSQGSGASLAQHTIECGSMDVLPNLSANAVYDVRSDARKIYDSLITAYKSFVSSNGAMSSFSIAGKSVSYKSSSDLIKDIQYWAAKVQTEEETEKAAKGFPNPRRVGVRFKRL